MVLEVAIELHSVDMGWALPLHALRIPVIVAAMLFRRRLPLLAVALAVGDVVVQGQLSAALPSRPMR